jgi:endo-1,4-beta-xylanase
MMRFVSSYPLRKTRQLRIRLAHFLVIGLLFFSVVGSARFSAAQVVLQSDFEDGSTGGWGSFCGAVVTNTTAAAESGTHALLASGRTQGCAGPSILLTNTLIPLATYQITGWVRLPDSESGNIDQADFTVDQTDSSSGNNFVTVGPFQTQVTNTGWVELSGQYTATASPTSTILYTQLVNSGTGLTDSFYLDNVTITEISGPPTGPQDNSGISTDFEDGFLDGWAPRFATVTGQVPTATSGCCTLTNTTADFHSGSHSVLVTGRTGAFEGPQINVSNKMFVGSTYAVSVWVKLGPSATAADTLRVSLQTSLGGVLSFGTVVGNTTVPLNTWVNLKIPKYSMGSSYDPGTAFLYVESNSGMQDFYIDDFSLTFIPPVQIEQNIASVFQTYANLFPIGTAIDSSDIAGPHSQLWVKHFNSMTSGNDMKWDATEGSENTFTYTTADAQVAFAQKNNIRVRGHNLVWANGSQVPAWVFREEDGVTPLAPGNAADKALLISRIQNHIQNVVTHFGAATYAWDVVNEPIDATQPDCLVHGPFYNIIGPQYIDIAFQAAHAANPNAELFLNDFNTTTDPKKTCLFNVVQGMIARGVPIDAVGHEMHINLQFPPVQSLADTVNQFHGLTTIAGKPLDQQVTEFDISVYFGSNPTIFTDYSQIPQDFFVQQGYLYRDFFQVLKQLNSDPANPKISSVTFWGMADDDTWLTSATKVDGPLLFDTGLQHKPAYTGIIDPLDLPGADLSVTMSAGAGSVLSGQSVAYTITVTNNGNEDAASLTLTDTLPSGATFQSVTAPAGWTCSSPAVGGTGTLSCTAAALANGGTAQFTLMVGVPCGTTNGAVLMNSANIASTTRDPNPDPTNNTATLNVSVSNPPPVISGLTVHPSILWPPDTLLHEVTLNYSITDNCTAGIVPVITVTSSQPVDPHRPRIIPMTDWKVVDAHHVQLRAIIDPLNLKGRTYTITLTATDAAHASTTGSVKVEIPLLPTFLF